MRLLDVKEQVKCIKDAQSRKSERQQLELQLSEAHGILETKTIQVPCRITGMRMLSDGYDTIERTILPPMRILIPKVVTGSTIQTTQIRYTLDTDDNVGVPIAHIFRNGSVCFGTVPVPNKVPIYKYLSPLDTLLGYNDRVVSHGGASFKPNTHQVTAIQQLSREVGVSIDIAEGRNWIAIDGPWLFCKHLLDKYDAQTAIRHAEKLYHIMWGTPTKQ